MNAENLGVFVPLPMHISIALRFLLYFKNKYKFIKSNEVRDLPNDCGTRLDLGPRPVQFSSSGRL